MSNLLATASRKPSCGPSRSAPTSSAGTYFCACSTAASVSLAVGLAAALGAAVIGTAHRPHRRLLRRHPGSTQSSCGIDRFRFIALPLLPLLIVLAAIDLQKLPLFGAWLQGPNARLVWIVVIVSAVGWTTVARLVRGATLAVRQRDYVRAAVALGAPTSRVMLSHILPNVASPIVVATTLAAGNIILLESVLSFLGLGIQPPMASWGTC